MKNNIEKELNTKIFGRNLYIFSEIDSTNTFARQLANQGGVEGTTVIADYQSNGKGRTGHEWISDHSKNILMSIIIRPDFDAEDLHMINFTTVNIVISAVQSVLIDSNINKLPLHMKWPNDIMVNHKKIGGILTESCIRDKKLEYVVVGIGLNVNQDINNFKGELKNVATSLYYETGIKFNREKIIVKILEQYEKVYHSLAKTIR